MRKLLLAGVAAAGMTVVATDAQALFIGPAPLGGQANDVFDTTLEGFYNANLFLIAGGATTATVSFLGAEAGFQNRFNLNHNGGTVTYTAGPNVNSDFFPGAGSNIQGVSLNPGLLNFEFIANLLGVSATVTNGANVDPGTPGAPNFFMTFTSADPTQLTSWDTLVNNITAGGGRSVIIALDDGGANADDNHDDLVVLITLDNGYFTVPEPASLALLGMGLLGLGFAARRRRG